MRVNVQGEIDYFIIRGGSRTLSFNKFANGKSTQYAASYMRENVYTVSITKERFERALNKFVGTSRCYESNVKKSCAIFNNYKPNYEKGLSFAVKKERES